MDLGVDLVNNVDLVDNVDIVDNFPVPRRVFERTNYFETYSDDDFFKRFRIQKQTALIVLDQIEDRLEYVDDRNNSLSPMNQLLLTLRTFATGGHLLSIADFIHADKATVSRVVAKVSRAIAHLAREYIHMPRNPLEIAADQNKFYDIANFPRVIGAIDGTHVRILSPGGNDAEVFRNRKGYFSLNVQAVSSADLLFKDVVARWPGSTHDVTIFNNSRLRANFEMGNFGNGLLLGDSGYSNLPYLFTPYLEPRNAGERTYNRSHISTRVKVEHLFGVWKRRFPIMAYGCRMKLENVLPVVIATAVLHNLARLNGEQELPPEENEILGHELQQALQDGDIPIPVQVNNLNNADYRRIIVENYFAHL